MAYTPDPDRRPVPPSVVAVTLWALAFGALFTLTPVIVRALYGAASGA